MKQRELEKLLNYYVNKEVRLHCDIVDYADRYRLRDCDQVDHLESIIAITRYQAFIEYSKEISRLLEIEPFPSRQGVHRLDIDNLSKK